MGLLDDLKRYRTPVLIGAGGLIAYTAFQRARAAQAVAVAPSAPGAIAPSGLDTAAAVALQQQAFTAGGGLGLQGAEIGLGVAQGGLDLGAVALGLAQGVTGDITGLAGTLGEQLANVSGGIVGVLPDLSPVIPPPTVIIQPPPGTNPPPQNGTPTKTVTSRTLTGYNAALAAGVASDVFTVNSSGAITGRRSVERSAERRSWSVSRRVSGNLLHWRRGDGWSFVPGRSANFVIRRVFTVRWSDGSTTTEYDAIPNTGS